MFLSAIDRYILQQIKAPVLFSFFIFSSLWIVRLLIRVLDLIITKGTPVEAVFKLILYTLPTIIVASVPMSMLMGVMLGLTKLNNDSEIIAMKAAGISNLRILRPLLLLGMVVTTGVFFLNERVVPMSKFLSQEVFINEITLKKPLPKIAKNIFFDGGKAFKLYVRNYNSEEGLMNDVTLFQFSGRYPQITEAAKAHLENGNLWVFEKGKTTYFDKAGKIEYFIQFEKWVYPISARYAGEIKRNPTNRSPSEMNMQQLQAKINERKRVGLSTREYETQYYWRTAFPFASLFMILVGAPLSMRHARGGKSSGFGTAILVMLFYYVLLSTGKSLSGNGTLPPLWANWIPNIASMIAAIFFIRRSRY